MIQIEEEEMVVRGMRTGEDKCIQICGGET